MKHHAQFDSQSHSENREGLFAPEKPMGRLGGKDLTANSEDGADLAQRKAVQRAANQSERVQKHLTLQRNVNRAMAKGVVQRAVFKDSSNTYESSSGERTTKDGHLGSGSSTKSVSFTKDAALPTPWKVLKDQFGEGNLKTEKLKVTKRDTLDRPRSVSAQIKSKALPERKDPITKEVGYLGNDELYIREGARASMYDGGHLIGAMILGEESKEAYDLAPQEWDQNEHAYNNTIENIARTQGKGTIFDYDVEVGYEKNNYSVDQATLKERGILKDFDDSKPWVVHIPARVPRTWSTTAKLTSGGNWKTIENKTKKKSLDSKEDVDRAVLNGETRETSGAFHFEGDGSKDLSFYSKQYVPVDTLPKARRKSSTKASSLENPDQYEARLPGKDEILNDLPGKAKTMEEQANEYVRKLNMESGRNYLTESNWITDFPCPDTIPILLNSTLNDRLEAIQNRVRGKKSSVDVELENVNVGNIYRQVYIEKEGVFSSEVEDVLKDLRPCVNSIVNMVEELAQLVIFGRNHKDRMAMESLSEGTLREYWKTYQKNEKRLKLIRSISESDRMSQVRIYGNNLNRLSRNVPTLQSNLNNGVIESFWRIVRYAVSDLDFEDVPNDLIPRRRNKRRFRS